MPSAKDHELAKRYSIETIYGLEPLNYITSGGWFVDMHGEDARWAADAKLWMIWNGSDRWIDSEEDIAERNKKLVDFIYAISRACYAHARHLEAGANGRDFGYYPEGWDRGDDRVASVITSLKRKAVALEQFANRCADGGFETTLKRASSVPAVRSSMEEFDSFPDVLNTPGGVVLLRDEVTLEHGDDQAKRLKLTKMTNACVGKCGGSGYVGWREREWDEFIQYVQPDAESRLALQRCFGYSMLGSGVEKASFFPYGDPDTGKTLLIEAVSWALGNGGSGYSVYIAVDAFKAGAYASDKYALADIPGARLLITSEFDQDMKINQNLLKSITGGEKIQVRQIRGVPFFTKPQCTLWVPTNNLPYLGSDAGSWVRMIPVPFGVSLVGHRFSWENEKTQNGGLEKLFRSPTVSAQILAWVIEGVEMYIAEGGLCIPSAWREVAEEERENQTPAVEVWIGETLERRVDGIYTSASPLYRGGYTSASALYDYYTTVLKGRGQKPASQTAFGRAMKKLGYRKDPQKRSGPGGKAGHGWDAVCSSMDEKLEFENFLVKWTQGSD